MIYPLQGGMNDTKPQPATNLATVATMVGVIPDYTCDLVFNAEPNVVNYSGKPVLVASPVVKQLS